MAIFNNASTLSKGQLVLRLTNDQGQPIQVNRVTYTILDSNSRPVSGLNLPAISQGNGVYYAAANLDYPNGSYTVKWSIQDGSGTSFSELIFVLDPNAYVCSPGNPFNLKPESIPVEGSLSFIAGSLWGPKDLPINFKDPLTQIYKDPYSVFYTLVNNLGIIVSPRQPGSKYDVGVFWPNTKAPSKTGSYKIKWDWQDTSSSITNLRLQEFNVINPCDLTINLTNTPKCDCDSVNVSRCRGCSSCNNSGNNC